MLGKEKETYLMISYWFQVLKVYPYPVTVTLVQFAVGTALVLFMWGFNLYKRPKISGSQVLTMVLKLQSLIYGSQICSIDFFFFFFPVNDLLAACSNSATGSGSHTRKPFYKHESWKSGRLLHSYDQSYGALLLSRPFCHVSWRGKSLLLFLIIYLHFLDVLDEKELSFDLSLLFNFHEERAFKMVYA